MHASASKPATRTVMCPQKSLRHISLRNVARYAAVTLDYESVHHAALTDGYGKDQHFEVEITKVKPEVCSMTDKWRAFLG